ncbi:MAG TPA: NfeD family protein [Terrimicrobiaceae bacterium]|nr:NfeD family protein [Terrimicrobiaceae bacterium]
MGPFEAIVVLIIVGFLLLAAEVFVPGLVLGLLGGLCLSGAVVIAFAYYDAVTGSLVFVGVCALTVGGFLGWMAAFPHTAIGRKIMLQKSHRQGIGGKLPPAELLGAQGRSLTPLRPAGTASIGGRKVDVVAESHFIASDEPIVVVREEGMRVVVRKKV